MPLLADALQPHFLRTLSAVSGRAATGTLADLIIERRAGFILGLNNQTRTFALDFSSPEIVAAALASDISRLSAASFQTMSLVAQELVKRDSVAWALVKSYYAAFYAGHALIRVFGEGCSHFGGKHVTRLNQLCAVYSLAPSFKLEGGLYHFKPGLQPTVLECVRTKGGVAGGTHEAFWAIFAMTMRGLADGVLKGSLPARDAQAVYLQIDKLLTNLARPGSYSGLSVMRNELQYSLRQGVWHPQKLTPAEMGSLRANILQWKSDPMSVELDGHRPGALREFLAGCAFVVGLCRQLLGRIGERSTVGARSFVRVGPIALLNDIGVPA